MGDDCLADRHLRIKRTRFWCPYFPPSVDTPDGEMVCVKIDLPLFLHFQEKLITAPLVVNEPLTYATGDKHTKHFASHMQL